MAVNHHRLFTLTPEIPWGISEREIDVFLEWLCSYSRITEVWYVLWQGGGAYRYTDILRYMEISRSSLSRALSELRADDLVRMVGPRYQAVAPEWVLVDDLLPSRILQATSLTRRFGVHALRSP